MNREIKYKRLVRSVAGNKYPFQSGLSLDKVDDVIEIKAFNSVTKTTTTGLKMQIPLESLEEVIEKLKELL